MAVDLVGLDVTNNGVQAGRTSGSRFPAPKWFLSRDATTGNIVLVQWDLTRQLMAFNVDTGVVTMEGT